MYRAQGSNRRPSVCQASGDPTELPFLSRYVEIVGTIMTVIEICTVEQSYVFLNIGNFK